MGESGSPRQAYTRRCPNAGSITALMRWRTFRAVWAFTCQIGVRTSSTSTLVTSETGRLPMRGKAWSSRLFSQVRAWMGLRQSARFFSTTRAAASRRSAWRRHGASRRAERRPRGRACGSTVPAPAPRRVIPARCCRVRSTRDRPTRFSDTTTKGASADGRRFVRRARHPLQRTGVRTPHRRILAVQGRRFPAHRRRTGSLNAAIEVDIAGTSLNRISKCFCVFANSSVPCHDHDQRRWLVNHLRCSQMHGVERTNWLDRKRSTDTSENRVCDIDYVTPKLKTTERAHCRLLFVGRQPRRCTRSKNRPCGSAIVNAEVTLRPRVRTDSNAFESRSRSAATSALDSMYRTPAVSTVECGTLALRFATFGVNQLGGSSRRKPDVRPPFCRVTGFEWWANNTGGDELVEAPGRAFRHCTWLDKLSDHAAMSRDRDTLAGLNPANVAAQVVFEFAYACGGRWTSLNGRNLHCRVKCRF